jgi:hypothetical protein
MWKNVVWLFNRLAQKDAAAVKCTACEREAGRQVSPDLTLSGGKTGFD